MDSLKAMILAAGRGERMRPLTDRCPKPLLEAGGKPLIVWHLERLAAAGIRDIIVNHAHLGFMIEDALGDGSRWGLAITYSAEREALETAGGIALALDRLGTEPFLVINGDVYCEADFAALANRGRRHLEPSDALAHLLLVDNPDHHPAGDFRLDGDRAFADGSPRLTFSGIGMYRPELFRHIPRGSRAKLGVLLQNAMARGAVTAERLDGFWLDVGTPERLASLDLRLLARGARQPANP